MGGYRWNGESVTCNGTGRNYSCNEYKERKSMVFNYDSILEYENLVINPMEQVVFYKEIEIEFTNREFQELYLLLLHRGIVLSKRQIYEQITDDNEKIDYHTYRDYNIPNTEEIKRKYWEIRLYYNST